MAAKAVQEFREALQRGPSERLNFAILTRERMEEVLNEAVERGRVTADDAQAMVQSLLDRARKETNDVVKDLEGLLDKTRSEIESRGGKARKRGETAASRARKQVESATSRARKQAVKTGDPALQQVDRVRRAARVGPSFPILGYDELSAGQVASRLGDLGAAELRKVRDYEKRNANRKSVLNAISGKLG
jgi:polyhydroxyalkanoate synthesis regulator phasin